MNGRLAIRRIMDAVAEIQELVRTLNQTWVTGSLDELGKFFHPDAVIVAPDSTQRVQGREACVQSYRDFLAEALVHRFVMDDAMVDLFGSTAVASCPYTIEYEREGRSWRGNGRDLLVLARQEEAWVVAWRTLLAGAEEEISPPAEA